MTSLPLGDELLPLGDECLPLDDERLPLGDQCLSLGDKRFDLVLPHAEDRLQLLDGGFEGCPKLLKRGFPGAPGFLHLQDAHPLAREALVGGLETHRVSQPGEETADLLGLAVVEAREAAQGLRGAPAHGEDAQAVAVPEGEGR